MFSTFFFRIVFFFAEKSKKNQKLRVYLTEAALVQTNIAIIQSFSFCVVVRCSILLNDVAHMPDALFLQNTILKKNKKNIFLYDTFTHSESNFE